MSSFKVLCFCAALGVATAALGQGRENRIYKAAVVALTQDAALRADFERQFVAKAREHNYDALVSYDVAPNVTDVRNKEFVDTMLGDSAFLEFALTWWPALDATDVLGWLRDPELLARVADGVLSHDEVALLTKSWADRPAGDWSVEDVALLDEIRYLLGDPPEQPHEEDPLAHLMLSVDGQRAAYLALHDLAHEVADGRWVVTGGGGYALVDVVPRAWTHLLGAVSGTPRLRRSWRIRSRSQASSSTTSSSAA